MNLEIGQVLWLKVRYQTDIVSQVAHPMLIREISVQKGIVEIIALDKARDKIFQLLSEANVYINSDSPKETVISMDSYAQLNNKLTLEYYDDLKKYRRTNNKLSKDKLAFLLKKYEEYHRQNFIKEERIVHMTKIELEQINSQ
jgi:hypothetical protein